MIRVQLHYPRAAEQSTFVELAEVPLPGDRLEIDDETFVVNTRTWVVKCFSPDSSRNFVKLSLTPVHPLAQSETPTPAQRPGHRTPSPVK